MFKSVVTKLWLAITALIMIILLVFTFFLSKQLEKIYFSNQVTLMNEHAREWRNILLSGLASDKIQTQIEFGQKMSHFTLTVFDSRGVVKYSSDPAHSPVGTKSNWIHNKKSNEGSGAFYSGYNPELQMEMTATFLPYTDSTGQKYLIMVHAFTSDLMEMIKAIEKTAYLILFIFLLISLFMGWHLSRWLAKPLIGVTKIALKMAKGDFSTLIETDRKDELGDLAKAMNTLSIRLDKSLNSLAAANSELTLLLKRWKDFLADVSHELRTPLFLIQGYSEAIIDKVVNDEQTENEYMSVINKETLRLQKLVNQILEMESGLPLHKVPTKVFTLVNDTIRPFEISATEKNIAIAVADSLKDLGPVNLDPDKMGEVIYNLVDNALRYTPENGAISISGKFLSTKALILSISDTGLGIPSAHLPQLFERFYRVDKARSRSRGGTGLGLAIVKNIVEQHGGTIEVKSKVNHGTTFTISLPMQ